MRLNKGWQVNDGADILRMHADYLNDCTFHNPTELDMDSGETPKLHSIVHNPCGAWGVGRGAWGVGRRAWESWHLAFAGMGDCKFTQGRRANEGRHAERERKQFKDFVSYVRSTRPTPFPPPRIAELVSSDTYIYEFGFAPINAEIVNFLCEFFIGMLRRWGNLHVLSVYSGVALIERQIHDRVREEFKGDAATTFRLECTDTGAESKSFSEPFLAITPLDARIAVKDTYAPVVMMVWPRVDVLPDVLAEVAKNQRIHTLVFIGEDCSGMDVVIDFMYEGAGTWHEVVYDGPDAHRQVSPGSTWHVHSALRVYTRIRDGDNEGFQSRANFGTGSTHFDCDPSQTVWEGE